MIRRVMGWISRLFRRPVVMGRPPRNRIASVRGLRRPSRPVVTSTANAIRGAQE